MLSHAVALCGEGEGGQHCDNYEGLGRGTNTQACAWHCTVRSHVQARAVCLCVLLDTWLMLCGGSYGRCWTLAADDAEGVAAPRGFGTPVAGPGLAGPYTQEPGCLAAYEVGQQLIKSSSSAV